MCGYWVVVLQVSTYKSISSFEVQTLQWLNRVNDHHDNEWITWHGDSMSDWLITWVPLTKLSLESTGMSLAKVYPRSRVEFWTELLTWMLTSHWHPQLVSNTQYASHLPAYIAWLLLCCCYLPYLVVCTQLHLVAILWLDSESLCLWVTDGQFDWFVS